MSKEREMARYIIDLFEEILDKYEINIPCLPEEEEERCARIYGVNYYNLEDEITAYIERMETR